MNRNYHRAASLPLLMALVALPSGCGGSRPIPSSDVVPVANGLRSLGWPPSKEPKYQRYPVPTPSSGPFDITAGPDGKLWFTEDLASKIASITTHGKVKECNTKSPYAAPDRIAVSATLLWYSEQGVDSVGSASPGCSMSEYGPLVSATKGVAVAANGDVWFTEDPGNNIGVLKADSKKIIEYPIPTPASEPRAILQGPDGAFWFLELAGSKIGRVTAAGRFMECPTPTSYSGPYGIAVGPDKKMWFTERSVDKIARLNSIKPCDISEYSVPTSPAGPEMMTVAKGALWFTELDASQIGRITTGGVVTNEYPTPDATAEPAGITLGPDGDIWFVELAANSIVKFKPPK